MLQELGTTLKKIQCGGICLGKYPEDGRLDHYIITPHHGAPFAVTLCGQMDSAGQMTWTIQREKMEDPSFDIDFGIPISR